MNDSTEGQSARNLPRAVLLFRIRDVAARARRTQARKRSLSYRAGLVRAELARR